MCTYLVIYSCISFQGNVKIIEGLVILPTSHVQLRLSQTGDWRAKCHEIYYIYDAGLYIYTYVSIDMTIYYIHCIYNMSIRVQTTCFSSNESYVYSWHRLIWWPFKRWPAVEGYFRVASGFGSLRTVAPGNWIGDFWSTPASENGGNSPQNQWKIVGL